MAPKSSSRLRAPRTPQPPSRGRTAGKRISYRESSSDSNDEDQPSQLDYEPASSAPAISSRPSRSSQRKPVPPQPAKPSTKRKAPHASSKPVLGGKRKKLNHNQKLKQKEQSDMMIQMKGRAMPWNTLPYQILCLIFEYASWPLLADDGIHSLPSVSWLLNTALCCKAFSEPALSALYYSPPLYPPTRARSFIDHLASQDVHSRFNYRAKVKYLDIEATWTLQLRYRGQDPLDLASLIAFIPQLRGIRVHRLDDNPKYRNQPHYRSVVSGKPVYHDAMFLTMQVTGIMLQDWTWNYLLAKQSRSLTNIKEVHSTSPFQTLRKMTLVNYETGPLEKGRRREDILTEALELLPNLEDLVFRMSSIVNSRLMPLLPDNLRSLEIFDCSALESPDLSTFLVAKAGNLRQLTLDHNHSLNLSFLVQLAANCPKLEFLRMDLRYFNTFFTVRDVDPKYDLLLRKGEVPSWPSSLQRLELFHLRKWNLTTAELFFSSLTDASRSLKDLRQLRIKATSHIGGWRDRIGFRDKWTQRLQNVFLRKSAPPNPHLKSFASFKAFKRQQLKSPASKSAQTVSKGTAQLSRVEVPLVLKDIEESDSDAPLASSKLRRSTRAKPHKDSIYTLSPSSSHSSPPQARQRRRRRHRKGPDDSSSEDSAIDDDEDLERTTLRCDDEDKLEVGDVQGMCDVVDVLIDNLRPGEEQWREGDFLDEEVSGDEDWNGDEEGGEGEGEGYAW